MKTIKFKTLVIAIIMVFSGNLLIGATNSVNEKNIKSKIESVTVFTQGAQIYRSSEVTVNQGITTLVFESLEPTIDPKSIQASGTGNFIIMDVQQNIKYPEPAINPNIEKNPKNLK
ncbi:MAG: DUF4140 domain-containing protein, partial [Bacteroidia bacterium]